MLALVSVPGSIDYRVIEGVHRDEALADPGRLGSATEEDDHAWWRLSVA